MTLSEICPKELRLICSSPKPSQSSPQYWLSTFRLGTILSITSPRLTKRVGERSLWKPYKALSWSSPWTENKIFQSWTALEIQPPLLLTTWGRATVSASVLQQSWAASSQSWHESAFREHIWFSLGFSQRDRCRVELLVMGQKRPPLHYFPSIKLRVRNRYKAVLFSCWQSIKGPRFKKVKAVIWLFCDLSYRGESDH